MPLDFFDNWMTDSWCIDDSPPILPKTPGIHELRWDVPDPLGDRLHGLELYDADADERMGWSFVVNKVTYLDIEEIYVKPTYRRRGHGTRLAEMIRELSEREKLPPRAWITYADFEEANRPALASILSKLGLNIRRGGVRWAAYRAAPSKRKEIVFESIDIPPKPAYARSSSSFAASLSGPAEDVRETISYGEQLTDDTQCEIADELFCALDAEEATDGRP